MNQNPLIGKTVTAIELAEDRQAIRFLLADGDPVIARADGDCCSVSWIEHISLPAYGFPAMVKEATDIEMPDLGEQPGRDYMQYYGFKVVTDKGDLVIDYRNESNGYYGGNLSWPDDDYYYGGVFGQNISKEDWRPVTQDE